MAVAEPTSSVLATRHGKQTLALLCAIGFLDFVNAAIVNVALPSIGRDLGFSVQNLQWVLGGYLLTYGGLMLLGGRAGDLLGRRRVLLAGTAVFMVAAIAAGSAQDDIVLVVARMVQGSGAAMMLPAALSILTTTFNTPEDRTKALGVWGGLAGLSAGVGSLLGGVLTSELDWRWVFYINLPLCLIVGYGIIRLIPTDGPRKQLTDFDVLGAVLVTGGMLLLVYAIVEAPQIGWGDNDTILRLLGSGVVLAGFVVYEPRHRNPLVPFSIFQIKGLAAADVTQVLAVGGFYGMFFFTTLYMQNVLGFSQIEAGSAYLPATFATAVAAGGGAQIIARVGTRPAIVAGAVLGAAGLFWMSNASPDGTYAGDLLGPLLVMSLGLGLVYVGVTTAAQAGVPEESAGLAAALINASTWLGGAIGVAILSAIAAARTNDVLSSGASRNIAFTEGFQNAMFVGAALLVAAALVALRTTNSKLEAPASGLTEPTASVVEGEVA